MSDDIHILKTFKSHYLNAKTRFTSGHIGLVPLGRRSKEAAIHFLPPSVKILPKCVFQSGAYEQLLLTLCLSGFLVIILRVLKYYHKDLRSDTSKGKKALAGVTDDPVRNCWDVVRHRKLFSRRVNDVFCLYNRSTQFLMYLCCLHFLWIVQIMGIHFLVWLVVKSLELYLGMAQLQFI